MNIAILIPTFPPGPGSGAELQAQAWAERLSSAHRVTVITGREPVTLPFQEERDGYTVRRFEDVTALWGLSASRRAILRNAIPRWVRRLRWTLAIRGTYERQLRLVDPRPDVLLCFMTVGAGEAGVAAGRRLGIPVVVWIRSEGEYRRLDFGPLRRVVIDTWKQAAGICVQSEVGRADLLSELQRVAPALLPQIEEKLDVVGNGVALPQPSPLPADGPVLSVGRLIPSKGMDVVIDACARLGRPLIIAGDGPERAALEAQASALRADVNFVGLVGHDALARLYRSAGVVVLASLREGMPNVLIEAMAYGRPVVATPCGGIPDVITDDANGLLVPPSDPVALATALERIYADPDTTARLGAAARVTAEEFGWELLQPKLEAALERRRSH